MGKVLRILDILKSEAVIAKYLTGETNIKKAAKYIASLGPKETILIHSEGALIFAEGEYYHFDFHSKSMKDRSGRGDTCVGSYVAKRLSLPPKEASKWAAATTSHKMETPTVFERSIQEVQQLIDQYYAD